MARKTHNIEIGLGIHAENGALQASILTGTAAPDGVSGEQGSAPLSSLYLRSGTSEIYKKIANAGAPADYEEISSISLDQLSWRNEKVRFATDDTIAAGNVDVLSLSDNDDMVYGDIAIGEYVIGDRNGTPALFEVTALPGTPNITVAAAGQAIADNDTFVVQQYLPDPSGQEAQAIVHFPLAAGAGVKIGDINWNFADGINMAAGYTAQNGTISSADTVNSAVEKLDGNQQDIQTASGLSQGDVDYGTFTGTTIPDSSTSKGALQALETAYEETDANVDDLVTLSGRPENSTDQGAMDQGDILSDSATENALFKEVDAELTRQRGKSSALAVTTTTVVDSVLVDDVANAYFLVCIENAAAPANKRHILLFAGHDGHAAADAVNKDSDASSILKLGSNFNYTLDVALSGAAGAQVMQVTVASTLPGGVNVYMKRVEDLF